MNIKSLKIISSVVMGLFIIGLYIFLQKADQEEEPVNGHLELTNKKVFQKQLVGQSVEGRKIEIYSFGRSEQFGNSESVDLLFVGGIHGGYEYNSALLAYEVIDYFRINLDQIPDNINIHIIPVLNPDGLFQITGKEGRFETESIFQDPNQPGLGRFNANDVDLNRNFDCKWSPESTWRNQPVLTGTGPFSEPEAKALRKVVSDLNPNAVVFWHSKANTVYASECENGVLAETVNIMKLYADSASYNFVEVFDAYPITGDAEGWLASINIPAITVELETRDDTEFDRNLLGIQSLIDYYETTN